MDDKKPEKRGELSHALARGKADPLPNAELWKRHREVLPPESPNPTLRRRRAEERHQARIPAVPDALAEVSAKNVRALIREAGVDAAATEIAERHAFVVRELTGMLGQAGWRRAKRRRRWTSSGRR